MAWGNVQRTVRNTEMPYPGPFCGTTYAEMKYPTVSVERPAYHITGMFLSTEKRQTPCFSAAGLGAHPL